VCDVVDEDVVTFVVVPFGDTEDVVVVLEVVSEVIVVVAWPEIAESLAPGM
jgi:hypothetical protein